MAPPKKKDDREVAVKVVSRTNFMDSRYHKDEPICSIPATGKKISTMQDYIPRKKDRLNYTISQTFCKMDAGGTKINLQQIRAEYEPMIVETKKKKRGKHPNYGRGPVWEYLEEKIARKIEEMQARYRREFEEYRKRKARMRHSKGNNVHNYLLSRVGPDWYQELSTKQLQTVDQLEMCIRKDIIFDSVVHTKENIANLGLVLRPNSKQIKIALNFCCWSPVEFLLILYQVINPKRTEYSLNDRLLLSAVVHLTMATTLKELHIRIPSPPKIEPKTPEENKSEEKKMKVKYASPYLVPFTFTPAPRKFTGVYENKHIQKPESPYFSYLQDLKFQPKFRPELIPLPPEIENESSYEIVYEIVHECALAQEIYNKLSDGKLTSYLYMPNLYPQCILTVPKPEEPEPVIQRDPPAYVEVTKELPYLQTIDKMQEQLLDRSQKFVIVGLSITPNGPVYIIGATLDLRDCSCAKKVREMEKQREAERYQLEVQHLQEKLTNSETKFVIDGISVDSCGNPMYRLTCVAINRGICLKHREAFQERDYVESLQEKLNARCIKFVLGSVSRAPNGRIVYEISAVQVLKKCICGKHEDLLTELRDKRTPVEKSQDHLKSFKQKFVIGGVLVSNGFPVHIITTVYDSKECTCGNHVLVYGKIVDKARRMAKLQEKLIASPTKFVIGGVTSDPNGVPVFNITSVVLRKELCERHKRQLEGFSELCSKHKAIEILHASVTNQRTKYIIGGVTIDRTGRPVFLLTQAIRRNRLCPRHLKPALMVEEALAQQEIIKQMKPDFAIGGVTYYGYDKKPVYIIQSVAILRKLCWKHQHLTVENEQIDAMQQRFKRYPRTSVISGVTRDWRGFPVYIISATLDLRSTCHHRQSLAPLSHGVVKKEPVVQEEQESSEGSFKSCNALTCKAELIGIGSKTYIEAVGKLQNRLIFSSIKYEIGGLTYGPDGSPVYIICGTRKQRECMCQTAFPSSSDSTSLKEVSSSTSTSTSSTGATEELITQLHNNITSFRQRFIIGGVTYDQQGNPVFIISSVAGNTCVCVRPLPKPKEVPDIYPLYFRLEAKRICEAFSESANKFVNGGIVLAPNGQPVFLIQSAIQLKESPCAKAMRLKREAELQRQREQKEYEADMRLKLLAEEEKLVQGKALAEDECVCKEECEKYIKRTISNRCKCVQCQEDLEEAKKIFIIEGIHVEKGEPIRIIESVGKLRDCTCLENYRKKVERFEDLKARYLAKQQIKSLPKQYAISGVTMGPDNKPIYILSGLAPEKKCTCADEYYKEQQRIANAPPPFPESSPKFIISGIRYGMDGNIYIVTGVVPVPPCDCMTMYRSFMDQHTPCIELFERYQHKVEKDLRRYMRELKQDEKFWENMSSSEEECSCETSECDMFREKEIATPKVGCAKPSTKPCSATSAPPQPPKKAELPKKSKKVRKKCLCKEDLKPELTCDCTKEQQCSALCKIEEELLSVEEEECNKIALTASTTERVVELKRYLILSKLPCDPIAQICILKEALETMADDGFPLARLPDCYMLPHFKLWMDMRCGKYWTQKDRNAMIPTSSIEFGHLLRCVRKCERPSLPLTFKQCKTTTFRKAKFYKQMVEEAKEAYIRKSKQCRIEDAREVFPATRHYEFPNKTFRNCFFAYLPSKEEDSLLFRKWNTSEKKSMTFAKRCT